jgi:single-stranded-DNA-specific exonuclease
VATPWRRAVVARGNFPAFAEAFDAEVRRQLREEDLTGRLLSDGTLAVEEFHLELARPCAMPGPGGSTFPSRCSMGCSSWSSSGWSASGT